MKNFKSAILVCLFLLISAYIISGCNEISHGLQRKKFEFLYKMNNYSSLFREYTGGISFYGDLEFYDNRMKKLYEDVNAMEIIKGYDASTKLKNNFLTVIDENVISVRKLKLNQLPLNENIRKEYEISVMNDRVDNLIKDLNEEISRVGKE